MEMRDGIARGTTQSSIFAKITALAQLAHLKPGSVFVESAIQFVQDFVSFELRVLGWLSRNNAVLTIWSGMHLFFFSRFRENVEFKCMGLNTDQYSVFSQLKKHILT